MEMEAAKFLAAGLAIALGTLGPGIGLGMIGSNMLSGIARNPDASGAMFTNMILIAGLTEAVAIYALIVSILLIFVA